MDCFKILDISVDSDIKTIKKAYAKLVKIHNPEDDPEGYQKIRKAYDNALKIAKSKKKDNDKTLEMQKNILSGNTADSNFIVQNSNKSSESHENEFDSGSKEDSEDYKRQINLRDFNSLHNNGESYEDEFDSYSKDNSDEYKREINLKDFNSLHNNGNYIYKAVIIKEKVDAFIEELCKIYNDLNLRFNEEKWEEVLQNPVVWDIGAFDLVEKSVIQFLLTHQYLPHNIYCIFDNNFEFTKNEIKLTDSFGTSIVEEIINRIKEPDHLSYDYINDIPIESLDEYLNLRELAYDSLKCGELAKAENFIKYAFKIYDKDPELIKLKGKLCYLKLKYKEAKILIKEALKLNPDDKEANNILKDLNWITYLNKRTKKFVSDYKKVFDKIVNVMKILFYIMILLTLLGFIGSNVEYYKGNSNQNKGSKMESYKSIDDINKTIENIKTPPKDLKNSVSDVELILSVKNNTSCNIYVDKIKETDYYIMKDDSCLKLNNDDYFKSKENIKSKIYLGKTEDKIILFSDYTKHSDKEKANITAIGKQIDHELFSSIKKDYSTYAEEGEKWFPDSIFERGKDDK